MVGVICHLCCCLSVYPCSSERHTLPYSDNGRCDLSPLLLFVCVSVFFRTARHCLTVTMVGVICHLCCCKSVCRVLQNGTTLPYSDNGRCDLSPLLLFVCVSVFFRTARHCLTVTMVGVICHLCCWQCRVSFRTARHCLTVTMVGVICHLCCCLSVYPFFRTAQTLPYSDNGRCDLSPLLLQCRVSVLQNGTHCLTVTMVGVICHLCCCLSVYLCTSERQTLPYSDNGRCDLSPLLLCRSVYFRTADIALQ